MTWICLGVGLFSVVFGKFAFTKTMRLEGNIARVFGAYLIGIALFLAPLLTTVMGFSPIPQNTLSMLLNLGEFLLLICGGFAIFWMNRTKLLGQGTTIAGIMLSLLASGVFQTWAYLHSKESRSLASANVMENKSSSVTQGPVGYSKYKGQMAEFIFPSTWGPGKDPAPEISVQFESPDNDLKRGEISLIYQKFEKQNAGADDFSAWIKKEVPEGQAQLLDSKDSKKSDSILTFSRKFKLPGNVLVYHLAYIQSSVMTILQIITPIKNGLSTNEIAQIHESFLTH